MKVKVMEKKKKSMIFESAVPRSFNSGANSSNSLIPLANRFCVAVKAADPATWSLQKHTYKMFMKGFLHFVEG